LAGVVVGETADGVDFGVLGGVSGSLDSSKNANVNMCACVVIQRVDFLLISSLIGIKGPWIAIFFFYPFFFLPFFHFLIFFYYLPVGREDAST
jgi:hypothetical protein